VVRAPRKALRQVIVGKPDEIIIAPEVGAGEQRVQPLPLLPPVVDAAIVVVAVALRVGAEVADDEIPGPAGS
jgi:hypothetical protein